MKVRLKLSARETTTPTCQSFNSMKVRLKHDCARTDTHEIQFQFHEGPIKTKVILCYRTGDFSRFNSMKVRLKREQLARLENDAKQFQFHEGPIKTRAC